MKILSEVFRPK